MKNITFSNIFIICSTFAMVMAGCERTDLQKSSPNDIGKITQRDPVDDCEDCPVDYCCCSIELWDDTQLAYISLCGFYNGDYVCGPYDPDGDCEEFSGGGEDKMLEDPDPARVLVCKEKNGVFRISNNTNSEIVLRATCQADNTTNPQYVIITIPAHGEVFYFTNGDCELEECS